MFLLNEFSSMGISQLVPRTGYIKMVDVWIIFTLFYPFIVIACHCALEVIFFEVSGSVRSSRSGNLCLSVHPGDKLSRALNLHLSGSNPLAVLSDSLFILLALSQLSLSLISQNSEHPSKYRRSLKYFDLLSLKSHMKIFRYSLTLKLM